MKLTDLLRERVKRLVVDPHDAHKKSGTLISVDDLAKPSPYGTIPRPYTIPDFQARALGDLLTVKALRPHKYDLGVFAADLFKIVDESGGSDGVQKIPGNFHGIVYTTTNDLVHAIFLAGRTTPTGAPGITDHRQSHIRHYYSSDRGETWQVQNTQLPFEHVLGDEIAIAADAQKVHILYLQRLNLLRTGVGNIADGGAGGTMTAGTYTLNQLNEYGSSEMAQESSGVTVTLGANRKLTVTVRVGRTEASTIDKGIVQTHARVVDPSLNNHYLGAFTVDTTLTFTSDADLPGPGGPAGGSAQATEWAIEYASTGTNGLTWGVTTRVAQDNPADATQIGYNGPVSIFAESGGSLHITYRFLFAGSPTTSRRATVYYKSTPGGSATVLEERTGTGVTSGEFRHPFRVTANGTTTMIAYDSKNASSSLREVHTAIVGGSVLIPYADTASVQFFDFYILPSSNIQMFLAEFSTIYKLYRNSFNGTSWGTFVSIADGLSALGMDFNTSTASGSNLRSLITGSVSGANKRIYLNRSETPENVLLWDITNGPIPDLTPPVGTDDQFQLATGLPVLGLPTTNPPATPKVENFMLFSVLKHFQFPGVSWYALRVKRP